MNNKERAEIVDYSTLPGSAIKKNKIIRDDWFAFYPNSKGTLKDSILKVSVFYAYDKAGNVNESKLVDDDGKVQVKLNYTYNAANKVIKEVHKYADPEATDDENSIYEFVYDSLGNRVYMYDYNMDTSRLKITHRIYDAKGKLIRVLSSKKHAKFYLEYSLAYNDDGSLQTIKWMDEDGTVDVTYLYEYDSKKRIKTIRHDDRVATKLYHEYTYDASYKCIVDKSIKLTGQFESDAYNNIEKYTYNKDGTLYTDTLYVDDKLKYMVKHYYKQ